jgi:hypothetical protein
MTWFYLIRAEFNHETAATQQLNAQHFVERGGREGLGSLSFRRVGEEGQASGVLARLLTMRRRGEAAAAAAAAATALPSPPPAARSLPFVYPVDGDSDTAPRFEIGAEALALLASLRVPVAPVAVVGRYRTGKSFLLNRLISGGGARRRRRRWLHGRLDGRGVHARH